jgi:hypothetical protein
MSEKNDKDLAKTQELFALLQGESPEGCTIKPDHMPKLTPDQAWTVIWWLGNQYWQPTDAVERCDVCGDLYHSWQEGECMDYGNAPYHFCDACRDGEEARAKARIGRGLERAKKRQCARSNFKAQPRPSA